MATSCREHVSSAARLPAHGPASLCTPVTLLVSVQRPSKAPAAASMVWADMVLVPGMQAASLCPILAVHLSAWHVDTTTRLEHVAHNLTYGSPRHTRQDVLVDCHTYTSNQQLSCCNGRATTRGAAGYGMPAQATARTSRRVSHDNTSWHNYHRSSSRHGHMHIMARMPALLCSDASLPLVDNEQPCTNIRHPCLQSTESVVQEHRLPAMHAPDRIHH